MSTSPNSAAIPAPYGNSYTPPNPPSDQDMMKLYPNIDWLEPLKIGNVVTWSSGLGCRLCIARFGLEGRNVKDLPKSLSVHQAHIKKYHAELLQ